MRRSNQGPNHRGHRGHRGTPAKALRGFALLPALSQERDKDRAPATSTGTLHGRDAGAYIRCCRHWYITLLVIEPTPWLEENQGQQNGIGEAGCCDHELLRFH